MKVTKYLLLPKESVDIGPQPWLCTCCCSLLVERISPTDLKGFLDIFPSKHLSQNYIPIDLGNSTPLTNSQLTISFSRCSFKYPNHWCQRSALFPTRDPDAAAMCSWVIVCNTSNRACLQLIKFPFLSWIQQLVFPKFIVFPLAATALTENRL